ncbi:Zn-dependent hydrolase [uncultured Phascolarctobacterium sp.]|uniref:Zn-dependent hydrolase n=1 Tax=uncultured Phascolarctobacterium sp. TaxID=512296 RepID=UPI0025EC1868|nr:Zn-dependent hydrolase [uncultured Phascolarctobacterium sp.]
MQAINKARVDNLLAGLAQFGATAEGITRLGYSALDREAQNWLLRQVADLGLTMREDAVGNVFLRREGTEPQLPPVACGSHLDTVIHGGAYDGMCGVVGALEALYMLKDESLTRSIEVIIFRAEESSRFGFATMGSKLMTGLATPVSLNKSAKKGDISFIEALRQWGCDPDKYTKAVLQQGCYSSFSELHIEQGKVLEETKHQIGIVHNIAAPTRFKLYVQGMADHSGATPMGMRRDALVAAAKLILAVNEIATNEKEHGTVGTVGVVEVEPGSINVVPGAVTLWVDVRGVDCASIERTLAAVRQQADVVAAADGVTITWEMLTADKLVALSGALAQQSETICRELGYSYLHMNSGAGHDAMNMAKLAPATMIFIPCRGGISHNPAEFAKSEDICRGVEVLAHILLREANKR